VFKEGSYLTLNDVSEDGSEVLAASLGTFAHSGSDTESHGSEYELSRSPTGWAVSPISPPAASFPAQRLLAATPSLDQTLWFARSPSESIAAENFYVRESDGAMVEIGPGYPPSDTGGPPAEESEGFLYTKELKYVAASADLSHVLFDLLEGSRGLAWPGDTTTGGRSLYEYSGRGQTRPELVGVNSEGHLISSCETYLGSPAEQDLYNAVSASGASVFFTAKACALHVGEPVVDEIYARLDQSEVVPISEPSAVACGSCSIPATTAEGRRSAEFAGASQDGSKVFFMTEQALLGGSGMSLYEYDFDQPAKARVLDASAGSAGSPVASGSEQADVQGVARVSEDGSHVYFVAKGLLTGANREGQSPISGGDNLYVFERDAEYPAGRVAFIATLKEGPAPTGDSKDWAAKDTRYVQATPDGRFLVFASVADLTAGDTSAVSQIFEYDAASEQLVRVSTGSSGYEPQGTESANAYPSLIHFQRYSSENVSPAQAGTSLVVSDDGATVVFDSNAALTAEALPATKAAAETNDEGETWNVYEYHSTVAAGGTIGEGDVYLISDGVNQHPAEVLGVDASGQDVFFQTGDQLVPEDTDTQIDVYDARVDGGFAAPDPPAGCFAEACGVPLASPPALEAAAGAVVDGGGNAVSPAAAPAPVSSTALSSKPKHRPLSRAEKLSRALKACHKQRPRSSRVACEKRARAQYGTTARAKKTDRRGNS
jgi:predicted lipoprotein with Yx(FWY)xxD motif